MVLNHIGKIFKFFSHFGCLLFSFCLTINRNSEYEIKKAILKERCNWNNHKGMLFIMTLALQLYTLIQREASNELLKRKEYLEGVMPNNIKTCRPKTDKILLLFENIMLIKIKKSEEKEIRGITSLNNIQLKILDILNVPKEVYTIEHYYKLPVNT